MADDGNSGPSTTLIPFNNLPSCIADCGPLYDSNGGCVPPSVDEVNFDCFCDFPALSPWKQGNIQGVCDAAPCNANEFSSGMSWFTSFCSANQGGGEATPSGGDTTRTTTGGSTNTSVPDPVNGGNGGDWLSNHWRWVIAIVIMVVGIAAIWIGACIWRRRYLKRRERENHFGKHTSMSAFPAPPGGASNVNVDPAAGDAPPGSFMPGSGSEAEKPKKKWIVRERT